MWVCVYGFTFTTTDCCGLQWRMQWSSIWAWAISLWLCHRRFPSLCFTNKAIYRGLFQWMPEEVKAHGTLGQCALWLERGTEDRAVRYRLLSHYRQCPATWYHEVHLCPVFVFSFFTLMSTVSSPTDGTVFILWQTKLCNLRQIEGLSQFPLSYVGVCCRTVYGP